MSQLALVLCAASLLVFPSAAVEGGGVSLAEYRQQLRDLRAEIDSLADHPEQAARMTTEVPDVVSVTTAQGRVTVSYRDLKSDLAAFSRADAQKQSAILAQMQKYVGALIAEADAYEQGANTDVARRKLADILTRREFNKARSPGAGNVLLGKILAWLSRLLSRLGPIGSSRFDVFHVLVYVLIASALTLLTIWTVRGLRRRRDEAAPREIIPFAPSARSWRAWLAEARSLAQRQDWRNAIHLAYWAGISFLEESGAWRPDRARTPREYLRLVSSRTTHHPPLAALTRKFEIVWYGHREASESDFRETLGQLEKLGCY